MSQRSFIKVHFSWGTALPAMNLRVGWGWVKWGQSGLCEIINSTVAAVLQIK